jgi:hypothetical protein
MRCQCEVKQEQSSNSTKKWSTFFIVVIDLSKNHLHHHYKIDRCLKVRGDRSANAGPTLAWIFAEVVPMCLQYID